MLVQKFKRPNVQKTLLVASAALMLFACGDELSDEVEKRSKIEHHISSLAHNDSPTPNEQTLQQNLEANLNLTFALHQNALADNGNAMLSAFSARQAFGMLYAGAQEETKTQIAQTIGFDSDVDTSLEALNSVNDALERKLLPRDEEHNLEAVSIHAANQIFAAGNVQWKQDYLDQLQRHLDMGVYSMDFEGQPEASREAINNWVEDHTQNRIRNLLPRGSVDEMTRAVLTNVIYFKAPWQSTFESELTRDDTFTLDDGSEITVPMMRQTQSLRHQDAEGFISVDLPFRGGQLAMTFVSPKNSTLEDFAATLNADLWREIVDGQSNGEVNIIMPKFRFETEKSLVQPLTDLGLGPIFSQANLSGMTEGEPLRVSGVFQKTFIQVEEGGAEAAAVTAIVVGVTEAPAPPTINIHLNKPFLFAIRDLETGHILFFGQVTDPSAI